MKSATVLLFTGIIGFSAWLTLCLTDPWAGFIVSLCGFIGLAAFIIFVLISYALVVRGNRRAQSI